MPAGGLVVGGSPVPNSEGALPPTKPPGVGAPNKDGDLFVAPKRDGEVPPKENVD